jgi:signal recognition particle subunit SRP54
MVLADLGKKINAALAKLNKATVIDEEVLKEILSEICNALLQADVNVKYVLKMRQNITTKFKMQEEEGTNLRKLI